MNLPFFFFYGERFRMLTWLQPLVCALSIPIIVVVCWLHFHFIRILVESFHVDRKNSYYVVVPLLEVCALVCALPLLAPLIFAALNVLQCLNIYEFDYLQVLLATILAICFTTSAPIVITVLDALLCIQRISFFFKVFRTFVKNFAVILILSAVVTWPLSFVTNSASLFYSSRFNGTNMYYFYKGYQVDAYIRCVLATFSVLAYGTMAWRLKCIQKNLLCTRDDTRHITIVFQALPIAVVSFTYSITSMLLDKMCLEINVLAFTLLHRSFFCALMVFFVPLSFLIASAEKRKSFLYRTCLRRFVKHRRRSTIMTTFPFVARL